MLIDVVNAGCWPPRVVTDALAISRGTAAGPEAAREMISFAQRVSSRSPGDDGAAR